MRILFLSVILFFSSLVSASVVGSVESVSGIVKVKSEGSFKKSKVLVGLELNEGDLVTTSKKGSLVIKLSDGSTVVVDVSSSIHFKNGNMVEQEGGKIFYKITSRSSKNSLKIKTPFAIIGIKGTTLIVNSTDDTSVILKEGLIGVESIKEEFELYRKKVQEEFKNYVSQQQSEFEKFKNAQNRYAIAESVKEFDLQAGNRISFSENRVNEDAWSKDDDAEFEHFMQLIDSMK
ncbi:MAG: FecR domain-containing protein [Campylobacterota bacterium]|nr:FecR domain-containing protein [Campylobacterota bacterium]